MPCPPEFVEKERTQEKANKRNNTQGEIALLQETLESNHTANPDHKIDAQTPRDHQTGN